MNTSPNILRLLPEVILTLTGVLIMLVEPASASGHQPQAARLARHRRRRSLRSSPASTSIQLRHPAHAFFDTIQVDAFSASSSTSSSRQSSSSRCSSRSTTSKATPATPASTSPSSCFGAVGMMLMTCSVELLHGLHRPRDLLHLHLHPGRLPQGPGHRHPKSSIKYFLLGSFATAFFLYGIALTFGATGSTAIYAIAARPRRPPRPRPLAFTALAMILIGLGFKVSAAPFHVWTPDVYQGAPAPVVGLMSTAPKAAAFAVLLRITFYRLPRTTSIAGRS